MASRRKEHQEDATLRVIQIITKNPRMTTREVAQKVGISNGSAYYLLTSLIDKGIIKLWNFKENSEKIKYSYLLTPKGIREKSVLTNKFLIRKKKEYAALRNEIKTLEQEYGIKFHNNEKDS
jgi:EPS-associated MarR family transcriptional regulator